jgi:hypothetical protein
MNAQQAHQHEPRWHMLNAYLSLIKLSPAPSSAQWRIF